jgi:hypothetical protein
MMKTIRLIHRFLALAAVIILPVIHGNASAQVFQGRPDYGRSDSSSLGTVSISAQTINGQGQSMAGTLCGSVYNNQNISPCNGVPIASIGSYQSWDPNIGAICDSVYGCYGGGGYITVYYLAGISCPSGYTYMSIQPLAYSCVKN